MGTMTMPELNALADRNQRLHEAAAELQAWVDDAPLVTREVVVTWHSPRLDGGHFDHLVSNGNVNRPLEVFKSDREPAGLLPVRDVTAGLNSSRLRVHDTTLIPRRLASSTR